MVLKVFPKRLLVSQFKLILLAVSSLQSERESRQWKYVVRFAAMTPFSHFHSPPGSYPSCPSRDQQNCRIALTMTTDTVVGKNLRCAQSEPNDFFRRVIEMCRRL